VASTYLLRQNQVLAALDQHHPARMMSTQNELRAKNTIALFTLAKNQQMLLNRYRLP
jgi:hypothetical protein